MANSLSFFDAIITLPGIGSYLKELAYHRYGVVSAGRFDRVTRRAVWHPHFHARAHRQHVSGSSSGSLVGRNSSWAQYTMAFCTANDNGGHYYNVDVTNVNARNVVLGSRTKFLRQYFLFVRAGAVRIGATSANTIYEPLAFTNTNGSTVVVIKANAAGDFFVTGLPAGKYGIKYTTNTAYNVDEPDVTLSAGQGLSTRIPAQGVITVYRR